MLDPVDLHVQAVYRQIEDSPALRIIAAQVMEMPARQTDPTNILGTPHGDYIAAGIFEVKLIPVLCGLRERRIRLPAGIPTAHMHIIKNAAGLDHIKNVPVAVHKRFQRLLEQFDIFMFFSSTLGAFSSNTIASANAIPSSGCITAILPSAIAL